LDINQYIIESQPRTSSRFEPAYISYYEHSIHTESAFVDVINFTIAGLIIIIVVEVIIITFADAITVIVVDVFMIVVAADSRMIF
jgi:hypothetical protein